MADKKSVDDDKISKDQKEKQTNVPMVLPESQDSKVRSAWANIDQLDGIPPGREAG